MQAINKSVSKLSLDNSSSGDFGDREALLGVSDARTGKVAVRLERATSV